MGELASILCTGLLPGLGQQPASDGGLKQWIVDSTYVPESSRDGDGVILSRAVAAPFVRAVSFDFERFALAAKESHAMAVLEWEKYPAIGWPLLKLYYAGFFSAHAIMRSRGAGVVRLDSAQINHVNNLLSLHGISSSKLSTGTLTFRRLRGPLDAANELSIALKAEQSGKGVHDSFWREFCNFLETEAAESIEKGEPDSQSFLGLATELKEAVRSGEGSVAWLSYIRNSINYQHKYETWLPTRRSSEAYKSMAAASRPSGKAIQLNVSKTKTPIKAFIHISCYLADINNEIGDYVSVRSSAGKAFGQKWRNVSERLG